MKRIDTSTSVPDGNGPGKRGFRDGSLATGISATAFNAAWCNAVQEEIASVIEGAGLDLDDTSASQLLEAIQVLILAPFTGANQSLLTVGFQKLPGGLILQWGSAGTSAGTGVDTVISFPLAFPNAVFLVLPSFSEGAAPYSDVTTPIFVTAKTLSTFTARNYTGDANGFSYVALGR